MKPAEIANGSRWHSCSLPLAMVYHWAAISCSRWSCSFQLHLGSGRNDGTRAQSSWPLPTTVEGYFALFDKSWLLGLLSLDLLYIVDVVLLVLIYLALYVVLRKAGESAMLIALVLGLLGIAGYFASNPAFEMLSLSSQYAAATTDAQRTVFLAAGQGFFETYRGTAFDIYYVLNTIVLFIVSPVMLRSRLFSKATAYLGFLAGILMIVPSTAGTLGLYFSLASLVPWAAWLVLVAPRLLQLGRGR